MCRLPCLRFSCGTVDVVRLDDVDTIDARDGDAFLSADGWRDDGKSKSKAVARDFRVFESRERLIVEENDEQMVLVLIA